MRRLPLEFYRREADQVAPELLGKGLYLRRDGITKLARIVEVEAYLGELDPASHAHRGETPRNRSMFQDGGLCYVYLSYGMHFCMNVVTSHEGIGQGVLLRAAEPLRGFAAGVRLDGPGRLTKGFGVTRADDGLSLRSRDFAIVDLADERPKAVKSPRIGITKAADLLLRFTVKGSPYVSRPWP